jgi:EAL domain-containing protein (putative c-di-GMP-specific phosphodiesterase class I)
VETDEQLDLLAKEGCQFYQGFLCAAPLTLDELIARVARA